MHKESDPTLYEFDPFSDNFNMRLYEKRMISRLKDQLSLLSKIEVYSTIDDKAISLEGLFSIPDLLHIIQTLCEMQSVRVLRAELREKA